ncbi:MAG: hypothetical protein WBQ45_26905, partial [Roseiarcus sp.]
TRREFLDFAPGAKSDFGRSDLFAASSADGRCWRIPDGRNRRLAAVANRDCERRKWGSKRS